MINFMRYRPVYLLISAIVLVPGVLSLIFNGLKPSIDFTGGTLLEFIINPPVGGSELKIEKERNEIKRREDLYRRGKKPLNVENKTVVLVDDGIATGATTIAAIRFLKRHNAKNGAKWR